MAALHLGPDGVHHNILCPRSPLPRGEGYPAASARFSLASATRFSPSGSFTGPMADTSRPVATWMAEHFR